MTSHDSMFEFHRIVVRLHGTFNGAMDRQAKGSWMNMHESWTSIEACTSIESWTNSDAWTSSEAWTSNDAWTSSDAWTRAGLWTRTKAWMDMTRRTEEQEQTHGLKLGFAGFIISINLDKGGEGPSPYQLQVALAASS
ncbi:hypothetical protein B0O80DRAFT_195606 [Mortierella sp. GBAus27b]|nr:hypothetical protein B0O80DRAFT_195606 [Mortierella sp. GBAus27b]